MKKFNLMALALVAAVAMTASNANAATTSTPQVTSVTVQENLALVCGDVDIDGGTAIVANATDIGSNTTTCAVTTNDTDGFHLQIREDTQLTHTDAVTTFPNLTNTWTSATPNAAQYALADTAVGFRVASVDDANANAKNDAWWGAATTCGNAASATELYAGLPGALQDIVEEDDYNSAQVTATICYMTTAAATQTSGEYTGQVTYSVTTGV